MAIHNSTIPLIAIDAVVIDSETTALDPANARVLELAGVRISGGRLEEVLPFRSFLQPGEPIPKSATAVHGIDAAMLASAPTFSDVWPQFAAFIGDRSVIGHSLGFDLAVLANECARAGLAWKPLRTLDVRLLAEVAEPQLAGYSPDQLAAWLNVRSEGRHSAAGDALTAARIFLALVPRLRDCGIRTLAEAERACRALDDALAAQHRAGWAHPIAPPRTEHTPPLRFDTYPFRHRVGQVMSAPQFSPPETLVAAAAGKMIDAHISSLFVASEQVDGDLPPRPETTAIVTERDVLRAIAEHGPAGLLLPVGQVASAPLLTISADAFVYRAIGRMRRLNVRHLGVENGERRLCGALSTRDLLRLHADEALWLGEEIDEAEDVPTLARAWARLLVIVERLAAEQASGRELAEIISSELEALTRRAAVLAEQRIRAQGGGEPPCGYAVAVLGSAGRGESLLALDQDNALIFETGEPDGGEDRWFAPFAVRLADILHQVGVPYCKGGVMAKNPQWRGSQTTWRARVDSWIQRSDPQDLLSVDIFFDLRAVHGETRLFNALRQDAYHMAEGEAGFAKLLAEAAGSPEPGLGWFGRFRTEHGRIDLKRSGLFGIVTAARVLAIRHHIVDRSTPARLQAIMALGIGGEQDLDRLLEAQSVFLDLIVRQQLEDIARGLPASNAVVVKELSARERERLRKALESVQHLDALTRDLLFRQ